MRPRLARRGEPLRNLWFRGPCRRFNAAPARSPGRTLSSWRGKWDAIEASMRPRLARRGEPKIKPQPDDVFVLASMRPRLARRGEPPPSASRRETLDRASMRPRLARRGELPSRASTGQPNERFNAAPARSPGRTAYRAAVRAYRH